MVDFHPSSPPSPLGNRLRRCLCLLVALAGCSPALKIPGPPRVVGKGTEGYEARAQAAHSTPAVAAEPQAVAVAPSDSGPAQTAPGVLESPTLAAQLPPPEPSRRAERSGPSLGEEAAEAAERFLKHRPRGARDDCSGFVIAAYDAAGLTMSGSAQSLWDRAQSRGEVHRRKRPNVGDLAYFDNTYDRNKNGRLDDRLTHIAIVLEVDKDGTVTLAHNGTSAGRTTMVMNLHEPSVHIADSGKVMNTYLRSLSSRPKNAKRLSGDLWRGFSTPQPDRLARND